MEPWASQRLYEEWGVRGVSLSPLGWGNERPSARNEAVFRIVIFGSLSFKSGMR